MKKRGVQYPVKILPDGRIIDGYHRWVVSQGVAPSEVVDVDEQTALEMGLSLNLRRRHLSHEQRNELVRELRRRQYTQEQVAVLTGFSRSTIDLIENTNKVSFDKNVNAYDPPDLRVKIPKNQHEIIYQRAKKGESHNTIAADYKITRERVSQIINIHEKKLDRSRAIEELTERAKQLPPLEAAFSTIVVDPPWPYRSRYDPQDWRGAPPYPEMSLEQIRAVKIPSAPDCALWLWATNFHLHEAFHVLEAWGFLPKTLVTWAKDSIGLGKYLRGQTEHCILAVRGHPKLKVTNQSILLKAPSREHSRKPDEFYKLVDELCEGPKLDYFGREPRTGWSVHGTNQVSVRGVGKTDG